MLAFPPHLLAFVSRGGGVVGAGRGDEGAEIESEINGTSQLPTRARIARWRELSSSRTVQYNTIYYMLALYNILFYWTMHRTWSCGRDNIRFDSIRSDPIQSNHSFKMKCDSELSDIRASLLGQSRERCRRSNSIPTHRYPLKAVARLTIQSDSPLVSLIVIGASQV